MCEPTSSAKHHAHRLLWVLSYLSRAVADGGQASELHLDALAEAAVELLVELGGFEDVLGQYQ